ncbi:uncharacterized protein C8Q71DRAFT_246141 [Rhodofomes roseus]|uniref:Uncharacterized protein n=1 Tax=Rhodofomes roseus TaxID=34475 RepID=A0ABQ8K770_9APHY|nr:uncharacterized protein C8Q71DRAFT_246141 [Rhodofomes roseus]KAH9832968.1 hypothetical protein C8Q71DRAFT_246141 [Rhodofomes roseus]
MIANANGCALTPFKDRMLPTSNVRDHSLDFLVFYTAQNDYPDGPKDDPTHGRQELRPWPASHKDCNPPGQLRHLLTHRGMVAVLLSVWQPLPFSGLSSRGSCNADMKGPLNAALHPPCTSVRSDSGRAGPRVRIRSICKAATRASPRKAGSKTGADYATRRSFCGRAHLPSLARSWRMGTVGSGEVPRFGAQCKGQCIRFRQRTLFPLIDIRLREHGSVVAEDCSSEVWQIAGGTMGCLVRPNQSDPLRKAVFAGCRTPPAWTGPSLCERGVHARARLLQIESGQRCGCVRLAWITEEIGIRT